MKPIVLLATTARWFPTARLAMALANAGFEVDAVCPSRHPLQRVSSIGRIHAYDSFSPIGSFADAIAACHPLLVIPGDEYAVRCLHKLHQQAHEGARSNESLSALIERSLGPAESFHTVEARAALMRLAAEESIRVPKTAVVTDISQLRKCCDQLMFPLVLKADGTSSGEGVRIVRTLDEAQRAFRALQAPPSVLRAAKRAIIDQDMSLIMPMLVRQCRRVNAQEFIEGQDATSLVACWNGKVLASLHFEVIKKQHKNGPASVMRRIEIPEMAAAITKIVAGLKLSGLHGFDFLLESNTGAPYLIEMNPRPTQVGHLTLGAGRDLPAALFAESTGSLLHESSKVTDNDTVALFPQEWMRNPTSPYLRSAYHDIPWEEPELIRDGARKRRSWSAFFTERRWASFFATHRIPPANE